MKRILIIIALFCSLQAYSQGNFFWGYTPCEPTLVTLQPYNIYSNSAAGGGVIIDECGAGTISIGICCSSTRTPLWSDNPRYASAIVSPFYETFYSLTPGTLYLYRTFVSSGLGITYGPVKTFTTGVGVPPPAYHNESRNYTFFASNCVERYGAGYYPNAYTYTVAHNVCKEASQAAADACADAIAAANGQAAANASGTCTPTAVYHNAGTSSSVQHTGCGYSCTGTYVTYTVAHATYNGQASQAAADALEAADLAAQIATNQGWCERPAGLYTAAFYYKGSGITWSDCTQVIDAAGDQGFTCDGAGLCASFTGQSTLVEGSYVYSATGSSCFLMQDGFYVVEYNGDFTPYHISGGKLYLCYS